jgi:phosphohistidine phosphatase
MKLYFLRHANADWPEWSGADDERPLTAKGKKQACRNAKLLRKLCVDPDIILSSPLPRAFETARIVAERLCVELKEEAALAKGFSLPALRAILTRAGAQDLMLVGHEPDFTGVIAQLTGASLKLAKCGVARVDLVSPESNGTLLWLFPPKLARL